MDLKDRIEGRKYAELVAEELSEKSVAYREGFVREVLRLNPQHMPPAKLWTLDESKAVAFEKRFIEFGVHQGTAYKDVPIEYLTWLADKTLELQAYLRSDRGRQRMETEQG